MRPPKRKAPVRTSPTLWLWNGASAQRKATASPVPITATDKPNAIIMFFTLSRIEFSNMEPLPSLKADTVSEK